MDIYDHSPAIPMKDGWSVSVSGHKDAAARIHIVDTATGGKASLLYDPLGKLHMDGIPTWEIYPINRDAACVRLDEELMPWIELAMKHSLMPEDFFCW